MIAWHRKDQDNRMYVNIEGGKKAAMPRYYKQRIYNESERISIGEKLIAKMHLKEIEEAGNDPLMYTRNKKEAAHAAERLRHYSSKQKSKL